MNDNIVNKLAYISTKYPKKVAITHNSETISYMELNEKSNLFADKLHDLGIRKGDIVVVTNKRCITSFISILAIIKLDAIYVPLNFSDKGYFKNLINLLKPKACLTVQDEKDEVDSFTCINTLLISTDEINQASKKKTEYLQSDNESIAYICFTSGSTGQPKGVMIKQKGILSLVNNAYYFNFNNNDYVAQTSPMEFDAFTFDFWGTILAGGTLVIVDKMVLLLTSEFKNTLVINKVNKMFLTTSLFNTYAENNPELFECINIIIAGGDVMNPKAVKNLINYKPSIKIINGYGPTENTTFSTIYEINNANQDFERIPIGKAATGDTVYILNNELQPCKSGEIGNIYVGGNGISEGYFNMPELTRKVFINNPLAVDKSEKIYLTGDLGYTDSNGDVIFIGRKDEQVKISGYRIELNSIKENAKKIDFVSQAEVILYNDNEKKTIVLFLVNDKYLKGKKEIKDELLKVMPKYMMPNEIIELAQIPYNTSGKPNKFELTNIFTKIIDEKRENSSRKLENIICRYTKYAFDETTSFFDAGITSLNMLMLANDISYEYKVECSILDLFACYNIKSLRNLIETRIKDGNSK